MTRGTAFSSSIARMRPRALTGWPLAGTLSCSMAAARAEPGAAVATRIERPGLVPSAQRATGEEALVASASAVPTSTLLVTGAALQVAPNILSIAHGDRLLGGAPLRAAFPRRLGHPLAPNLRRGRHAMHRVRRAHDGARGRDGPRVHRPPARRVPSRARPTRRRLTSPPSNARHVAPPVRHSTNARPRPETAESRPPHAPTADTAPPSCEPSPTTLAYSPQTSRGASRRRADRGPKLRCRRVAASQLPFALSRVASSRSALH